MKVLMMNGSRREEGCTYTALTMIGEALKEEGIDWEIVQLGKDSVNGNLNQLVETLKEKCQEADAFVFGSPVYYASPSGEIQLVLDRLFSCAGDQLRWKPAAVVTSARRAGTTSALEVLSKYPSFYEMPLVTSNYWTMVHGQSPEDVRKDEEGVAVMKVLGRNMAWILKSIEAGRKAGVKQPEKTLRPATNFIR